MSHHVSLSSFFFCGGSKSFLFSWAGNFRTGLDFLDISTHRSSKKEKGNYNWDCGIIPQFLFSCS